MGRYCAESCRGEQELQTDGGGFRSFGGFVEILRILRWPGNRALAGTAPLTAPRKLAFACDVMIGHRNHYVVVRLGLRSSGYIEFVFFKKLGGVAKTEGSVAQGGNVTRYRVDVIFVCLLTRLESECESSPSGVKVCDS
jgi:hypothetical protein